MNSSNSEIKEEKKDKEPPLEEINSFKFEENIFNQTPQEPPKKKGKGKKPKAIDFMDYAQSKGIEINIQYEDVKNQIPYFKDKKDFSKPYEQKKNFKAPVQSNNEVKKSEKDELKKPFREKKDFKESKGKFGFEDEKEFRKEKKDKNDYHTNNMKYNDDFYNDTFKRNYDYGSYYSYKDNYYNKNYYNNYNYEYNTGRYGRKNYYDDNYEDNYYKKKKNQIAIELPDPTQQNQNMNQEEIRQNIQNQNYQNYKNQNFTNNFTINQIQDKQVQPSVSFSKVNKFDKPNQKLEQQYLLQAQEQQMYQTMMRMNYYNQMPLPVPPIVSQYAYPIRDEEILDNLESIFTLRNLNKDISLREKMDENGWINAEYVITLSKMNMYQLTPERASEIIDKIGSDFIEKRYNHLNQLEFKPKLLENMKNQLLSINEIRQKMLTQVPPTQPPMAFNPPMYPMMNMGMNMYMQRPQFNPLLMQQMQLGKINIHPNLQNIQGIPSVMPFQNLPKKEN